jgi:hypothetical protein
MMWAFPGLLNFLPWHLTTHLTKIPMRHRNCCLYIARCTLACCLSVAQEHHPHNLLLKLVMGLEILCRDCDTFFVFLLNCRGTQDSSQLGSFCIDWDSVLTGKKRSWCSKILQKGKS